MIRLNVGIGRSYKRRQPLAKPYTSGWYWHSFGVVHDRGASYQAQHVIYVPHWAVLLAAMAVPALRIRRSIRRALRSRAGRCLTCGYDLRASPERCPECGTEAGGVTLSRAQV